MLFLSNSNIKKKNKQPSPNQTNKNTNPQTNPQQPQTKQNKPQKQHQQKNPTKTIKQKKPYQLTISVNRIISALNFSACSKQAIRNAYYTHI